MSPSVKWDITLAYLGPARCGACAHPTVTLPSGAREGSSLPGSPALWGHAWPRSKPAPASGEWEGGELARVRAGQEGRAQGEDGSAWGREAATAELGTQAWLLRYAGGHAPCPAAPGSVPGPTGCPAACHAPGRLSCSLGLRVQRDTTGPGPRLGLGGQLCRDLLRAPSAPQHPWLRVRFPITKGVAEPPPPTHRDPRWRI